MSISQNIARVREQIDSAARRAARDPQSITLMAITKTVAPERIREAYAAGVRVFGENRVQEFAAKHDALADLKDAEWHMSGICKVTKPTPPRDFFTRSIPSTPFACCSG